MGVSHGKGHFTNWSQCCRGLGVFKFTSPEQIETFFEMANNEHLPESARLQRRDFIIEEWNWAENEILIDEDLLDACREFQQWVVMTFPVGMN